MCYFLTIAVPLKHALPVEQFFPDEFHIQATTNPTAAAALPSEFVPHLVTVGLCSCGLYSKPDSRTDIDRLNALRQKHEAAGWSKAKIDRAINQMEASASNRERREPGLRNDVVKALSKLCRSAGRIALFVHWYGGAVDTESLDLVRTTPCAYDDFVQRAVALREDELLLVSSG